MRAREVIVGAAGGAALLRYPGLIWPLRPDEAGFILVARNWDPQPDSLYGPYFVDRPPLIIALVKLADLIGGAYFLRLLAAIGVALFVVAMAATAKRIAGSQAAVWTALVTAALVSSGEIEPDAAKGEVLSLPLLGLSFWLAVVAWDRERSDGEEPSGRWGGLWYAAAAGFVSMVAVGLKQSMLAGLVFGTVVLVGAAMTGRITWARFGVLAGAALAGASVVVGGVVAWTVSAGVRLEVLWYTVVGFRSDATAILADQSQEASAGRGASLLLVFLTCGMALVLLWFLISLRPAWRAHKVFVAAALAVFAVDVFGVVAGGSFWRPYLFNLVPSMGLMVALAASLDDTARLRARGMRIVVGLCMVLTVVSSTTRTAAIFDGELKPSQVLAGQSVAGAAHPGDTAVVFGGRADLQLATGLPSPYQHLWSLPMRTLDPELADLRALLQSDQAPTWFIGAVPLASWELPRHEELIRILIVDYHDLGWRCGIHVFVRNDAKRDLPEVDCEDPWWDSDGPLHPEAGTP